MIPNVLPTAYFSNTFSIWPTFFWILPRHFFILALGRQVRIVRDLSRFLFTPRLSLHEACL